MVKSDADEFITKLERIMSQPVADLQHINVAGDCIRACVYFRLTSESVPAHRKEEEIRSYYLSLFKKYSNWQLIDLFEDTGKSSVAFRRLIKKAKQGEYDIIITPSFIKLSNHLTDTVDTIRELKALTPPVGIYFEIEEFFSLGEEGDLLMNMACLFAEWESRHKSRAMRWSTSIKHQTSFDKTIGE